MNILSKLQLEIFMRFVILICGSSDKFCLGFKWLFLCLGQPPGKEECHTE
jgi:hypothetical protein